MMRRGVAPQRGYPTVMNAETRVDESNAKTRGERGEKIAPFKRL